jgi:phosphatidylinositol alpha-1,6-mannosyltransferase
MILSTAMKKILIVTRNFPPLLGGMERLNLHMVEEISRQYEVCLVAPEGAVEHAPKQIQVSHVPCKPLSKFLLQSAWRTLQKARDWKPDIILAGSGLTAPAALIAARSCGARAIAYTHGLDLTVPHPVYRALWCPMLRRLDGVIANSQATAALATGIGIAPARISIVHPGVSLSVLDSEARARFRQAHQLGDVPVMLSVGRLASRKGLREFVSDVLPLIVVRFPNAQLVIIGDAPSDSLYAQIQSPESIMAVARTGGVENNLRFLGRRSDSELSDAYAGADLHVFPVRHLPDDPEGFGMVAVEAAAHGLATVAYATGGVVDAVSEGESGSLVPSGDTKAFADKTIALLEQGLPQAQVRQFAGQFAWPLFGKKILAALEK